MTRLCILFASASLAICSVGLAQGNEGSASATTQPAVKPANTKCPVSGEDVDPAITTTYQGKTVAFCCKDCIGSFKKDPEKYMKKLK